MTARLFNHQSERRRVYENIPTVIFRFPPTATVGLTEEATRQLHGEWVKIYQTHFTLLYHTITEQQPATAMKLVCRGLRKRSSAVTSSGQVPTKCGKASP